MNDVRDELKLLLARAEAAFSRGTTAEELSEFLYEESLLAVTEGVDSPARGTKEFIPRLDETLRGWGPKPNIALELCEPILYSDSVAASFVNATVRPDVPDSQVQKLRALLVWRRDAKGWRVALEMYALGSV